MAQELISEQYLTQALAILPKGAFLTTAADGKVNTMTIGWGSIGTVWQKPCFMVMVRQSRYTHELIEKGTEFTVSIPVNEMKKALGLCGTKSGRDMDKISAAGLTLLPGKVVGVPVIKGCGLHFECKIVYKQTMEQNLLEANNDKAWYANGDYHTLYYGEIVAAYEE